MLRFLAPATQATYPKLMATPADFYFELYHLCVLIQIRQAAADHGGRDVHERGEEAAKRVLEVFEIFENEPASLRFIAGIFPTVAARSRARIDDFDDFSIAELPDLAHLGNEVLNRVSGMPLAEKALTALYLTHLREAPPAHSNPNPNPNPYPSPNPNPNPNLNPNLNPTTNPNPTPQPG